MKVDVLVVGSVNRDRRASVRSLARPGETVLADGIRVSGGGKGANQAAAAARAGATVAMVGAVGDDDAGRELRAELERSGIDVGELKTVVGVPTGTAFITVADDGENTIVVDPGANAYASVDLDGDIVRAAVVLAQLEIPTGTVAAAAAFAAASGARFVLNAAPAPERIDQVAAGADPLVANQHEAARLLGGAPGAPDADAQRLLEASEAVSVVVTLGPAGSVVATRDERFHVSAVEAARIVDTTGAGDTFTGALAANLARGASLRDAARTASEAAAEAVGWSGARPQL